LLAIGAGISLILTVPTIIIGRFICGFSAGILNMSCSKSIVESVPVTYTGAFGAMTNVFLNIGMMVCTVLGMALPSDKKDYPDD